MLQSTIAISADVNYLSYAETLISQIRRSDLGNYSGHITFITPSDTILSHEVNRLAKKNQLFHHSIINFDMYPEIETPSSHLTKSTYARIFLEKLIPLNFKKCLYMDIDVLIKQDLNGLLNLEVEKSIIALPYKQIPTANSRFFSNSDYFNAGVMLINLEKWRRDCVMKKSLEIIEEHGSFEYADQDVLNIVLKDNWQYLNEKFNYIVPRKKGEPKVVNPVVIHFAGFGKPWKRPCGKYGREWRSVHAEQFPKFKLKINVYFEEIRLQIKEKVYETILKVLNLKSEHKNFFAILRKVQNKLIFLTCASKDFIRKPLVAYIFKSSPLQISDLAKISYPIQTSAIQLFKQIQDQTTLWNLTQGEASEIFNLDGPIHINENIFPLFYNSGAESIRLIQLLIKITKPKVIVETGIGNGISTASIIKLLQSSSSLKTSIFHSLDVETRTCQPNFLAFDRWVFHHIKKSNTFEDVMKSIGKIDFFYHDSDHNFTNQLHEYEIAFNNLRSGGILVSDDINYSNAFFYFCANKQIQPFLLFDEYKLVGLLFKT
jgi:lipopolysaccharide biosynthesis glycosyltransferase